MIAGFVGLIISGAVLVAATTVKVLIDNVAVSIDLSMSKVSSDDASEESAGESEAEGDSGAAEAQILRTGDEWYE